MEIITMARPKKNKVKLTDDEIKHLKSILKKKDTNKLLVLTANNGVQELEMK